MSLPKGEKTVLCFNWVYIATRLETMINYGLNLGSLTTSSQLLGLTLILLFEQRDSNHQRWRSWNWLKLRRAFGWLVFNKCDQCLIFWYVLFLRLTMTTAPSQRTSPYQKQSENNIALQLTTITRWSHFRKTFLLCFIVLNFINLLITTATIINLVIIINITITETHLDLPLGNLAPPSLVCGTSASLPHTPGSLS